MQEMGHTNRRQSLTLPCGTGQDRTGLDVRGLYVLQLRCNRVMHQCEARAAATSARGRLHATRDNTGFPASRGRRVRDDGPIDADPEIDLEVGGKAVEPGLRDSEHQELSSGKNGAGRRSCDAMVVRAGNQRLVNEKN